MKKVLSVLLVLITLAVAGYAIFYYQTSLTISTDPTDAVITVDSNQVSSGEKMFAKPGAHEINIEKDKYIPCHKLLNNSIGSQTIESITLRLLPVPQKAVDSEARFTTLSLDKNSLYYLSDKTMYAIDDITEEKLSISAISPDFFDNVSDFIWAPNQSLAIIKQNSNTSLYNFSRYDLLHQEITPFDDSGIKDTVWSSDSKNIMYYYEPGTGEKTLIKATPTNTDKEIIYNFKDTQIKNPEISLSDDIKDVCLVSSSKLYDINLYTKNMIVLSSSDEVVLEAEFMPNGDILMITKDSVYSLDRAGQNRTKLDFYTDLSRINFIDENNLMLTQKENNKYEFYTYSLLDNTKTKLFYNQNYNVNPTDSLIVDHSSKIYFQSNNYLYTMTADDGEY